MNLSITQRATLRRRFALRVCIECCGIVVCRDTQGRRREYPLAELRDALGVA